MKRKFLFVLLSTMSLQNAHAESPCQITAGASQSVVECAQLRSPIVQEAELDLARAKAEVQAAAQWKNPEFSAESFRGKIGSDDRAETDIAIAVPIELGGKIAARQAAAESGVRLAEANLRAAKDLVTRDTTLKLHRLSQVIRQTKVADEAISTFTKLVGQYAKRPGLSPEQKISASVFQLSKNEYELKLLSLNDEKLSLQSYFSTNLGLPLDQISKSLPSVIQKWPAIGASPSESISNRQAQLAAELEFANASLAIAQAEAWPTITVGPSVKFLTEAGQSNQLAGINLSLPLPLFNLNGGARAAATAGVRLSEARVEFGRQQQMNRRNELMSSYEQSVKVLMSGPSQLEIGKRHTDAERLFSQGLVPSSLVIEAHRTSFDLEQTRHERELKTIELLFEIYTIDGKTSEVKL